MSLISSYSLMGGFNDHHSLMEENPIIVIKNTLLWYVLCWLTSKGLSFLDIVFDLKVL